MRDQMEFERVQMEQTNVLQHSYGVTSCTLCGRTDSILADEHTKTKQCVLCAVTDFSEQQPFHRVRLQGTALIRLLFFSFSG